MSGSLRARAICVASFVIRCVLVFLMCYSSWVHFANPIKFSAIIAGYGVRPHGLSIVMAHILPWIQLCIAAMLVDRAEAPSAAVGGLVLTSVFVIAQVCVMARGGEAACGCFDVSGETVIGVTTILRTLLVSCLFLSLLLLDSSGKPERLSFQFRR